MESNYSSFNDFFYQQQDTKDLKHCELIRPNGFKDDDDIRKYRSLIEDCFALHLPQDPKKLSKKDIKLAPREANKFYNDQDISNLFITEFYNYPDITEYYKDELSVPMREIQGDKVFTEILGHIANPNTIIVLVGDVGEGKSALLKRLAIDLSCYSGEQNYIPIIIDIQRYNKIIENENIREFWIKVCTRIINFLETEYNMFIPTSKTEAIDSRTEVTASFVTTLQTIFMNLKTLVSGSSSETTLSSATRAFDIYSQLQIAAKKLYKEKKTRIVLIFDNLDTFCYEHERFMLFETGFAKLKSKISTAREIINEVNNNLSNSEISFVFTARPYVYYHVFQNDIHDISDNTPSAVYRINPVDPVKPIQSRLSILKELAEKLNAFDLPEGKKKAVSNHNNKFITIIQKCINQDEKPFVKLYNLSNQGMRSMVEFYHSCYYHPDIYLRYYTHNILYLYMLGRRKLYSQIIPETCSSKQIYFFPNLFLVMCPNYYNIGYSDACQLHKITYWLKYLILWVCYVRGKISIRELLDIFSDYEEHVVRLAIGSLATVNQYNCLMMEFNEDIDIAHKENGLDSSINKFIETTHLIPTKRGKFLVEDHYCLDFDCLQFYIDDWLLPLPKTSVLGLNKELLNGIYMPQDKTYSYEYLLDITNYELNRRKIIKKKAKQSLLLMYFLESALKGEQRIHPKTWEKIRRLSSNDNPLLDEDKFKELKERLIETVFRTIGRDRKFKNNLIDYKSKLDRNKDSLDAFFLKAVNITIPL